LELLDLSGAIVTIDAMGCQKEIARQVREVGDHYVLAVKDNQGRLLEDIQACFAAELDKANGEEGYSYHETVERGHGRCEKRYYFTIENLSGIRDQAVWEDLRTISMVVSERQVIGEEVTSEVRYYIGCKPGNAQEYAGYIRGH
jgi:predicted transposase YbfD/YdcC